MQPIYPYVAVEKIEDDGSSLALVVSQKPVVKVISIPTPPEGEAVDFHPEQNILVNHVDEYMVKGEKMYFVRIKDIVAIV